MYPLVQDLCVLSGLEEALVCLTFLASLCEGCLHGVSLTQTKGRRCQIQRARPHDSINDSSKDYLLMQSTGGVGVELLLLRPAML